MVSYSVKFWYENGKTELLIKVIKSHAPKIWKLVQELRNTDLNEPKMKLTVVSETIINIKCMFGLKIELADESLSVCHRFCLL